MKKHVLFVALATIFSISVFAQEAARPDTAMGKPAHEAEDVMAIYCNHYTTNNLHYDVQRWVEGIVWEELTLGADSTKVYYCPAMSYEGLGSDPIEVRDFSGYKKLHFDVWVPDTVWISLTVETSTGAKHHCPFRMNAGWNTIDAEPAWWDKEGPAYDWKDVKFLIFDQYMTLDSVSYDGHPFAFANIYFWNEPTPDYPENPMLPTMGENGVMALFCPAYQVNTVNFEPQNWGNGFEEVNEKYYYASAMTWGGFANWGAASYDLNAYDMFACDIWVEQDSKIRITFEAVSGWKNGDMFDLKANEWNNIRIDLYGDTYGSYNFKDLKCMILENYTHEGTPLGIANAYFYDSKKEAVVNVETNKVATKRLIDGKLVIIKNGVQYTVLGTQF